MLDSVTCLFLFISSAILLEQGIKVSVLTQCFMGVCDLVAVVAYSIDIIMEALSYHAHNATAPEDDEDVE